ncbi:glycosyltransferase [Maribacter arcticus]|jgi:glycosyltransferase involved in cell wall biosynthesis|uniref:glycosyltransferase n=1 Tax=Maribacter arcticus TaxID=561365 RepID=UPI002336F3CE|nr:glycosyltransferase [bacterium]|tara:strand:+ start:3026 stop:3730 length:705 start_codon:yes stop_codon:yes gene_type:complete
MISIIIPVHNEFKNLQRLFKVGSFLAHNKLLEIIVAVSPSNSDSVKLLDNIPKVKIVLCEKKGRAAQMNKASKMALGSTFVFLHADVVPPVGFIDNILHSLQTGYDAGFFSYRFDKDVWYLRINASFTAKDGLFTGGGDQCLFIKKDVFRKLGTFNEEQALMEDFEFFSKMKKLKVPYTIVKNDLVVSARKYECNSYLRVNLTNLLLVILFKLGYPGDKLKTLHNKLIRTPYNG